MGSELYLIIALIAGFGFIAGRDHWRRRRHLAAAERQGLLPSASGLAHLPACFQESVLFLVGDGGHERQVSTGALALQPADDGVTDGDDAEMVLTVFDFTAQRDVRGEWGYLDSRPRFRIFSPLTVVAVELPTTVSHLLIKRRGGAEIIAEDKLGRYKSVADIARDVSTIERAMAVAPPPTLPRESVPVATVDADYLVWAEDPALAATLLDRHLADYLRAPALAGQELIIEILDSLILVYCARDGALSGADADRFVVRASDLVRTIYARLLAVDRATSRPPAGGPRDRP